MTNAIPYFHQVSQEMEPTGDAHQVSQEYNLHRNAPSGFSGSCNLRSKNLRNLIVRVKHSQPFHSLSLFQSFPLSRAHNQVSQDSISGVSA